LSLVKSTAVNIHTDPSLNLLNYL